MLTPINPSNAPQTPTYAQGVAAAQVSTTLFISGQVGVRPDGAVEQGIEAQTTRAIANLGAVLAANAMDFKNVAKYTVFLTDEKNLNGFMAAGMALAPLPAVTLVYVKALISPAMLVEIEAIAVK
jgi:2-iminobutanoate/2-iminopropanoate deaminase